jgi:uncharacterized protein (DUF433 family)/DNA-binding transcriptional MerR regulator
VRTAAGSPDLLRTGIYTVSDAADLIGVSSQKIRAWIAGWPRTVAAPVLENDLGWVDGRVAFSFANLMELRFIAFFEGAGVKLREIRRIMDAVRAELRRPHPFATNVVFKTDGAKIVAEIAHRNGIADLYDLRSRNFEIGIVVYKSLKHGVVFDPKGDAQAWFPRRKLAPNVIIHPSLAFGRPVLRGRGIPTEAIANAAVAEGSIEAAAIIFEIPTSRAKEAVTFEQHIRRAA